MSQATAQRVADSDEEPAQQPGNRPVLKYRHGRLELAVWPNQTRERHDVQHDHRQQLQG